MKNIYQDIVNARSEGKKLLAILLDPDKISWDELDRVMAKINNTSATHILVGGSLVEAGLTHRLVAALKPKTSLPIVLFPGDVSQLTPDADALLFLSLLSGRNPEYLIGQQVKAIPILQQMNLEVIPTSYILIDGEKQTAVARVSDTQPIPQSDANQIMHTAKAGELLGHKLVYLEAGSGALTPVSTEIIRSVSNVITIPLIVGGGIRSQAQMQAAYDSGADMVVIGTAFEQDMSFFE
jgi:phosphoglycerol geranylgeranyltransferase